jgi:hypothetical protein
MRTTAALTMTLASLLLGACGSTHDAVTTRTVTVEQQANAPAGASQTKPSPVAKVPARTEPNLIAEAEAKAVLHGKAKVHLRQFAQALRGYASCMRANGVAYPSPNVGGHGQVDTKLDTTTAQFKAAEAKCTAQRLAKYGG